MLNMSYSATTPQFMAGEKDITRRLGWEFLKPGDFFMAVEKGMGLKKGQKVKRLGKCRVVSVRRERLAKITADDVRREGFPGMTPAQFITMFCEMNRCGPARLVTRIEFARCAE